MGERGSEEEGKGRKEGRGEEEERGEGKVEPPSKNFWLWHCLITI